MTDLHAIDTATECELVIAFIDVRAFARACEKMSDHEIFTMMAAFQDRVGASLEGTPGRIVKFIGDAALIIFPVEAADDAIKTLRKLKKQLDPWLAEFSQDCRLGVKTNAGPAVCGPIGPEQRFDLFGKAVNNTARLKGNDFCISPELQVRLQ